MTIGKRLKKIRNTLSFSQISMAENLAITQKTYSNYELDKREIIQDVLIKLSQLYSVDLNWLLLGLGENMFIKEPYSLLKKYNSEAKENFKKLGDRLILIQEKNGLTNFEMADLLGISESSYLKLSISKATVTEKELTNIKENFDVNIDWLMFGNEKISNDENTKVLLPNLTPKQYKKLFDLLNS